MRYLKSLIIAAFALVIAAGSAFAEGDALEIHGGGRIGVVVNSLGGSAATIPGGDALLGTMPNYAESRYMALHFSKKTTADGGAWAKISYSIDYAAPEADGDLELVGDNPWNGQTGFRNRQFLVEFGGLDFLPAGSSIWGGLRGYGTGWVGQQDYQFINLAGIGFGISNLGGMVSIAYMGIDEDGNEDAPASWITWTPSSGGNDPWTDLGERTLHTFIISVNTPMVEAFAALGYCPAAEDEDAMTEMYAAAIYHAPVLGLNVGLAVATNNFAKEMITAEYDTVLKGSAIGSGVGADDVDLLGVRVAAWTVTDLAEGLYIAPALRFDMLKDGSDAVDNTEYILGMSFRLSQALTQNIALVPTLGYMRAWDAEDNNHGDDADQTIQATLGVEIGLDTGFWSGQKIQFYGTYTMIDDDDADTHSIGGGYEDDATSSLCFGMLVTFGF